MIRKIFSRSMFTIGMLMGLGVLLTSCLKDNEDMQQTPVASLMAFNLAPDQESINIALNGNLLPGSPFGFGNYTGQYLNVFPGNRHVESFHSGSTEIIDSSSFNFEANKFYSLFVVGNNGDYTNIITEDNYDSLSASSGKTYVRFINALSNAPSSNVRIQSSGNNVLDGSAEFGEVSSFLAVEPGDISIRVSNEGAVDVNRTISLAQGKAYTVLLMGLPNDADPNKTVQIKFIENGTVTD